MSVRPKLGGKPNGAFMKSISEEGEGVESDNQKPPDPLDGVSVQLHAVGQEGDLHGGQHHTTVTAGLHETVDL